MKRLKLELGGTTTMGTEGLTNSVNPLKALDLQLNDIINSYNINFDNLRKQKDAIPGIGGGIFKGAGAGASAGSILGPVGTGVGAGLGALFGGIFAADRKKDSENAINDQISILTDELANQKKVFKDLKLNASKEQLETYSTIGNNNKVFAKYGGAIPYSTKGAMGGVIKSLTPRVQLTVGDTHEQDSNNDGVKGITLKGLPNVELENNELLFDNKVLSNRIGMDGKSFSEIGKDVVKSPVYKKYENGMDVVDKYKNSTLLEDKNTVNRIKKTIPNPLDNIFKAQESLKTDVTKTTKMEGGGYLPIGDVASNLFGVGASFMDNIAANKMIDNTPSIPTPILKRAVALDPKYDNSSEVNAVNDVTANILSDINSSSSSPGSANIRRRKVQVNALRALNSSYQNKNNKETAIRNRNREIGMAVSNENIGTINNHNMLNMQRLVEMNRMRQANTTDMSNDMLNLLEQHNQRINDNRTLDVLALKYANTGVLERNAPDWLKYRLGLGKKKSRNNNNNSFMNNEIFDDIEYDYGNFG